MTRTTALATASLLALVCTVDGREPQPAQAPEALTDTGLVRSVRDAATGIAVFRGMPYAAPPVSDWWWRPPRPAPPWTGVRQVTDYGTECPQGMNASSAAGTSAGAKAVATLLVSPLTRGLFHRAMLQSGIGLDDSVEPLDDAEARGARTARLLGVDQTGPDAARRLRALPVGDIVAMSAKYRTSLQAAGAIAPSPWRSVVDGSAIPQPVDALLQAGAFHRVPILIGTNADEGSPGRRPRRQPRVGRRLPRCEWDAQDRLARRHGKVRP